MQQRNSSHFFIKIIFILGKYRTWIVLGLLYITELPRIIITIPHTVSLKGQVILEADVDSNEIPNWMTWLKKPKTGEIGKSVKLKHSAKKFEGSTIKPGMHSKLVINGFDLDDESVYCLLVHTSHGFGKSEDVTVDITRMENQKYIF